MLRVRVSFSSRLKQWKIIDSASRESIERGVAKVTDRNKCYIFVLSLYVCLADKLPQDRGAAYRNGATYFVLL